MKKIAITTGDPAGCGPQIVSDTLRFLNPSKDHIYVVYGRLYHFDDGNRIIKIDSEVQAKKGGTIYYIKIDSNNIKPGKPNKLSGKYALEILKRVVKNYKYFDAVVNAPISKKYIRMNQEGFIGHTEFFEKINKTSPVVMSFWSKKFCLALLTTHKNLSEVESTLTEEEVIKKITIIYQNSEVLVSNPKIALLCINPHCGEDGAFGKIDLNFKNIVKRLNLKGIPIYGPFSADTFFTNKIKDFNLIISGYHDQGLIPFKTLNQPLGVNVTLGLPFLRVSVDHGTAFDKTKDFSADSSSFENALCFTENRLGKKGVKKTHYNSFAKVYDEYMSHVNYSKWENIIFHIFKRKNQLEGIPRTKFTKESLKRLEHPIYILELACGTGNLTQKIVQRGFYVDAVDNSVEMLKMASKKRPMGNLYNREILFPFKPQKYSMVLLIFDSINYLTKTSLISKLFENIYTTLKNGGLFIFDISTKKNCKENFNMFLDIYDGKDIFLAYSSRLRNMMQKTEIDIFEKKECFYSKSKELHLQRIYTSQQIIKIIKKSRFSKYWIFSNFSEMTDIKNIDTKKNRLFFALRKDK